MKPAPSSALTNQNASLEQQRISLRRQLAAQREQIATQLAQPPISALTSAFPRSILMRLITLNASTPSRLGVELARLLFGERFGDQLGYGLSLVKIVRHLWRR